mmetsp:Transcript_26440/g.61637  ORF Transcript_26440/g.61637 Transcript_26440/m.61637 type:complete len:255 (+) Transcript_26440:886-1650(+)
MVVSSASRCLSVCRTPSGLVSKSNCTQLMQASVRTLRSPVSLRIASVTTIAKLSTSSSSRLPTRQAACRKSSFALAAISLISRTCGLADGVEMPECTSMSRQDSVPRRSTGKSSLRTLTSMISRLPGSSASTKDGCLSHSCRPPQTRLGRFGYRGLKLDPSISSSEGFTWRLMNSCKYRSAMRRITLLSSVRLAPLPQKSAMIGADCRMASCIRSLWDDMWSLSSASNCSRYLCAEKHMSRFSLDRMPKRPSRK